MCRKEWEDREAFLNDETLELNGYGADFEIIEDGLFYFTHNVPGCKSTMALKAGDFFDLYTAERSPERKRGADECPGLCLDKDVLDRCSVFCEYAFVREVIQVLLRRHNRGGKEFESNRFVNGVIYEKK